MAIADCNGTEIYYKTRGAGEPLLLIGGVGVDSNFWAMVSDDFAKHYQVILMDNRGSGRSARVNDAYTVDTIVEDCRALLDHLNIDRAHIVAHSLGTAFILQFALTYPERLARLVLCAGFMQATAHMRAVLKSVVHMKRQGVGEDIIARSFMPWLYEDNFLCNDDMVNFFIEGAVNYPYRMSNEDYELQVNTLLDFDVSAEVANITAPTLVLAAELDRLVPARLSQSLTEAMPNAQLKMITRHGHNFPIEGSGEFTENVLSFLQA